MTKTIAFQGTFGANSDMACRAVYPQAKTLPCISFDDAFLAVQEGRADTAMIPVENSVAGRVADVHRLLPKGGLHIVGEHYQPIEHHLLVIKGAKLEDIKTVESHVQALAQCHTWLRDHKIRPIVHPDTAAAAEQMVKRGDKSVGAIASTLAAELYGLDSVATNIADAPNNTTRFLILARELKRASPDDDTITTLIFRVRSVPAALYKALGGFATNGVNITKLESYLVDGSFTAAQFYVDVEAHPESRAMRLAMEELAFFAQEVTILGVYPAHPFRRLRPDGTNPANPPLLGSRK
ncbi:MAG: prephenate dehydratase [Alphaproteobacteria bacterium]|nr:prephenate dehydratase [Alphaproteobacteria bacterium]